MKFQLIHEVGNRQRWRTRTPLSSASASLIADELQAIAEVTGVVVNPRTGSVIVTYDTLAARARVTEYLASLDKNPPINRAIRAHYLAVTPAQKRVLTAFQPSGRAGEAVEIIKENRLVGGVRNAIDSGVHNMPILTDIFYPVLRFFGFRKVEDAPAQTQTTQNSGSQKRSWTLVPWRATWL